MRWLYLQSVPCLCRLNGGRESFEDPVSSSTRGGSSSSLVCERTECASGPCLTSLRNSVKTQSELCRNSVKELQSEILLSEFCQETQSELCFLEFCSRLSRNSVGILVKTQVGTLSEFPVKTQSELIASYFFPLAIMVKELFDRLSFGKRGIYNI
ncbi:hypothetical protein RRG08_058593 [Elysia crispata]|uniref:Uncharacterized protein n=1 Tax=Elysia crispata TaxID=231223 RepID=A0AAE0YMP0_9GAST|nr:hypothetical protein RRG08_058593 [Elysia crispata]